MITIDPVSITMNEAETQADGYYRDSRDDTGAIILDFENNEMYITITSSNTHAWDILYSMHTVREQSILRFPMQ